MKDHKTVWLFNFPNIKIAMEENWCSITDVIDDLSQPPTSRIITSLCTTTNANHVG